MEYVGRNGSRTLFVSYTNGVVIDESKNLVVALDIKEPLLASSWDNNDRPADCTVELAAAALTNLDIKVFSNNDRMYTIPDAVVAEAKRGLEWHKEHHKGGTSVGLNTARTLARGGQIGIQKVRHVAKYFPRHEVDKKGKGYKPGGSEYPSKGRIAWALWGGDAASRWASAIVERENKKAKSNSLIAFGGDFYEHELPTPVDYNSFIHSKTMPEDNVIEFYVRIRMDGSGIDRLYRIEPDSTIYVWDDGNWDDMGNPDNDMQSYDKMLDNWEDTVPKTHMPVDTETALLIAALLDNDPLIAHKMEDIQPEEHQMILDAAPEIDWKMLDEIILTDEEASMWDIDDSLTAAGEAPAPSGTVSANDGQYSPAERSKNASSQVRDKSGKFAKMGSKVIIGGRPQYQGNIRAINPDTGNAKIELANGNMVEVPVNITEAADAYTPLPQGNMEGILDTNGILGEPRTPMDSPIRMPGTLPPLNAQNMNQMLTDYPQWVADQRLSADTAPNRDTQPAGSPGTTPALTQPQGRSENPLAKYYPQAAAEPTKTVNAYNIPTLRNWMAKNPSLRTASPFMNPNDTKKYIEKKGIDSPWLDKSGRPLKASADDKPMTPETSDVPILHMAIVSPDDPQAVMDLIALVPASGKTTEPATFTRKNGQWIADDGVLADLRSATPPPTVVLDDQTLLSVLEQVDGKKADKKDSVTAAGGVDRNRGKAEELRRYWLYGKGAAKIRWRTPGDWTRCHKYLAKYMGPRSKGYCALRHKEANGYWPGDKQNTNSSFTVNTMHSYDELLSTFIMKAKAADAKARVMTAGGYDVNEASESKGSAFIIPLVIPEGVESGDGRKMRKGALTMRELPLPLLWQIKTGEGHNGSVVVGQITHMERTDDGIGNASGFFDTGEYGKEAERLVRGGFIRGVSADLDQFEASEEEIDTENGSDTKVDAGKMSITKARVMAVTIVPKPAFQECTIQLADQVSEKEDDVNIPDGVYVEGVDALDASALVACGMIAGAIPVVPPTEWFQDPQLKSATPLTITDEGQVYGHIAAWHVDHIGMSMGTKPPRSRSKYAYFHTGVVRTEDGSDIPVGQLTLAGGHASLEASAMEAARHYDDTASAIADVHAGEDAYGIWVAGSVRSGASPEQIRALRASAPSGDWRPIKNSLELVAVCQVNVPGFPIARARVASGQVMALVAAGAKVLAELKHDPLAELNSKIDRLQQIQLEPLVAAATEAKAKFSALQGEVLASKKIELAAKIEKMKADADKDSDYMHQNLDEDPESELAVVTRRVRERLASEGKALPDGSFPIRDANDLKHAIRAYGRAKAGHKGSVKKHIMKRAAGLGREELIPENWKGAASDLDEIVASMKSKTAEFSSFLNNSEALFSTEETDSLMAAGEASDIVKDLSPEEIDALKKEAELRKSGEAPTDIADPSLTPKTNMPRGEGVVPQGEDRPKYTPETQPRDATGKFRQVLARIKENLGTSGLDNALKKIEEAENFDNTGDYAGAAKAAGDLLGIIDRLDSGALNSDALENVRNSAGELGKVIANLPFAFGEDAQKIRFSDVPPALRDLMTDMIDRVEAKIGKEDADAATEGLKRFMSGGDYYNQSEISSEMAKLLRLLT
jgi:hypothetical protein